LPNEIGWRLYGGQAKIAYQLGSTNPGMALIYDTTDMRSRPRTQTDNFTSNTQGEGHHLAAMLSWESFDLGIFQGTGCHHGDKDGNDWYSPRGKSSGNVEFKLVLLIQVSYL
jgi:hypothetical protein